MKIIGFNLTKILVEKRENQDGKIQISQNIDIKDLIKDKIPISNEEILNLKFHFIIDYSNNLGKLEFDGYLILLPEKNELKDFLKSWKDKKIPEDSRVPLFNFIMSKCNIKALNLEDELGLPYHIPMPRVNPGEKQ
jgi:hypothetical protein